MACVLPDGHVLWLITAKPSPCYCDHVHQPTPQPTAASDISSSLDRSSVDSQSSSSSTEEIDTEEPCSREDNHEIVYLDSPIERLPILTHDITLQPQKPIFCPTFTSNVYLGSTGNVIHLRDVGVTAGLASPGLEAFKAGRMPMAPVPAAISSNTFLTQAYRFHGHASPERAGFPTRGQYSYGLQRMEQDSLPSNLTESAAGIQRMLQLWGRVLEVLTQPTYHLIQTTGHHDRQPSAVGFLDLPAEVRNSIYSHLLPDSTIMDDCGLMWTCKQINEELSSMIVAYARGVIEQTVADSTRLRASASESPTSAPYIITPTVSKLTQLRAIHLAIRMDYSTSGHGPPNLAAVVQEQPGVTFYDIFADVGRILSLHLPFVTIIVTINAPTNSVWEGRVRYSCLHICYWAFKNAEKQRPINVRSVIFDLTGNRPGPYYKPGYQPYIAFLARKPRASERVRFAFLGHEPRPTSRGIENADGPVRAYENVGEMNMLDRIVRRSRVLGEQSLLAEMVRKHEAEG